MVDPLQGRQRGEGCSTPSPYTDTLSLSSSDLDLRSSERLSEKANTSLGDESIDTAAAKELRTLKQAGRHLEHLSRKSGLNVHTEAYKHHLSTYRNVLSAARSTYFSNIINSSNKNSRTLFSTVSKLLQLCDGTFSIPSSELCNSFLQFFRDNITKINSSLTDQSPSAAPLPVNLPTFTPDTRLSEFAPIDSHYISKLIMSSKTTTCSLDPLPTVLIKACLPALCPYITHIVNFCLAHQTVPSNYKTAAVTHILKKPGLDTPILNNLRPISNLRFLAKTGNLIFSCPPRERLSENPLDGNLG
ncbi:unnamed protein product [Coregonus sp. 'balchen']|nr:unnamed protein product [Coregonus sp. 'balchen']